MSSGLSVGSGGISVGGLASGLDTNSIIDGLVAIEKESVTREQTKEGAYKLTLTSWGTLTSNLTTLQKKAEGMKDPDAFDKFNVTSSDDTIATVEGKDGATPGSFSVSVYQLAKNEKVLSKIFSAPNLALGVSGSFTVNRTRDAVKADPTASDVSITVKSGDTLKDIQSKINGAQDIGITATIVKMSETEYGLSLTSKDAGADGATYKQTDGTVLQSLGILNSDGEKGNETQKVQSTRNTASGADMTADTLFSEIDGGGTGPAINDTISITGTDHNGNTILLHNFVVSDPGTLKVSDLLKSIEHAFNGMVTATVENGRIMVADKTTGDSSLTVNLTANNEGGGDLSFGGSLAVNTAGKNGVLQTGANAFFSVDGLFLSANTNQADDSVEGVTIDMKKADITQSVSLTQDRDLDKIKSNVQGFLDAYNALIQYISDQSKVSVTTNTDNTNTTDPTKKQTTINRGPLSEDSTVGRLKDELNNLINTQFTFMKDSRYKSLASVGIMLNQDTGQYEIDDTKFKAALNNSYEDVKNLFVQQGQSQNTNFIYGRTSENTSSGRYLVDVDARTVSLLDNNDKVIKTFAATVSGNVLLVKEKGEAQDLSLTVPASGSAVFTFSKGVGMEISDYIKKVTDTYNGYLSQRKKNIQDDIDQEDKKISDMNDKVEQYRQKLVKQFSDLEQTMSKLQSQSASMTSALK